MLKAGATAFTGSIIPSYAIFEQLKFAEIDLCHNIPKAQILDIIANKYQGRIIFSALKASLAISAVATACAIGYHISNAINPSEV